MWLIFKVKPDLKHKQVGVKPDLFGNLLQDLVGDGFVYEDLVGVGDGITPMPRSRTG